MGSLITLTPLWLDRLIFSMGDILLCDPTVHSDIHIHGQRWWHLLNPISLKMTSLLIHTHIQMHTKHKFALIKRGLDCTLVTFTWDWLIWWKCLIYFSVISPSCVHLCGSLCVWSQRTPITIMTYSLLF